MVENNKYIKDIFNFDELVKEGYTKIFLIAGVGSGKSTWVTNELTQKGNVLFVTSRKAKVNEDIRHSTFSDIFHWYTNNNQTLITNAKLANVIEGISSDSTKDLDDFLDHFDYIVIDEVHSIATDSAYADSCASVLAFIEYVSKIGKIIICMTGTPEPIQSYFESSNWYIANYLKKCNHVHPKRISLISNNHSLSHISKFKSTNKMIYFANHTDTIISLCKKLLDKEGFSATEIAISVAKNREKDFFNELSNTLTHPGDADILFNSSQREYNCIINEKCLTEECKILISTSVLKEGINIKNPNMVLFCENHVLSNLIQYFGRAREGGPEVFIIEDSTDHQIKHNSLLFEYAVYSETDAANQFLKNKIYSSSNLLPQVEHLKLTKHVSNNPYIYYDNIACEYKVFFIKFREEQRLLQQNNWKRDLLQYCDNHNIEHRWFNAEEQYKSILLDLAKGKKQFWGEKQKAALLNLLKIAYKITFKQPNKINSELEKYNAPFRISNGKATAGDKRDMSYWQLCLVDA